MVNQLPRAKREARGILVNLSPRAKQESKNVNKGQKSQKKGQKVKNRIKKGQKSQISEIMKRTHITDQNEALSVSNSEKLVFRSKRSSEARGLRNLDQQMTSSKARG